MNAIIANVEHVNANLQIIQVHLKLTLKMEWHRLIVKSFSLILWILAS